jgi:hypothetical protein
MIRHGDEYEPWVENLVPGGKLRRPWMRAFVENFEHMTRCTQVGETHFANTHDRGTLTIDDDAIFTQFVFAVGALHTTVGCSVS